MSVSSISATIASIALAFLILGFVFGWVRGYQKSLTRLLIVLIVAVIAFFVTPAITNAVLQFNLAKYNVTVGGQAVATVKDYIIAQISQIEQVGELMESSATLREFVTALPAMLVNVILFTVVFFLLKWISMVIYWIFAGTLFSKKRLEGKSKVKLVGAGVGCLQALIALAILLVPFFGFANISTQITNEYNNANVSVASANYQANSPVLVADGQSESQIEGTVKEVDKYVSAFNNTWVVKVYSAFGINKLSVGIFNDLSTQKVNNVQTNLTKELTTVSKMLPYVDSIMENGTEINTAFVNNLDKILDTAFESEIINNIVGEVVSSASAKWVNGEQFLGLDMPKVEGNDALNVVIEKVFNSMQENTVVTIKTDTQAIISVLKILTEDDIISVVSSGNTADILDAISNENKNTIADLVSAMLESTTLKLVIPDVLNIGLDYVYEALNITIPEGEEDQYKITKTADEVVWDEETIKIQKILGNIARVYADYEINYVQYNQNNPQSPVEVIEVIDFSKIGIALDSMKSSDLFGAPSKKIFESLINNEMLTGIIPEATRTELINSWETINMEATFTSLNEMVVLAKKLSDTASSLGKEDIANVLETIVSDGVSSGVVESILSKENLQNAGLDETTAGAVSEVVTEITNQLNSKPQAEKQEEINGIATAIDIISQAQLKGEGETITIEDTDATINAIANSQIITELIESNSSSIGQIDISNKIDSGTKANLENSITNNSTLTETQKQALINMLVGGTN